MQASHGVQAFDWTTHPTARAVWLAHANFQPEADGTEITTPTQQIATGPAISGTGVLLRTSTDKSPAYFDPAGVGYWQASAKSDFDWLHQKDHFYLGLNTKLPSTIKILFFVPFGSTSAGIIFQNNGASSHNIGTSLCMHEGSIFGEYSNGAGGETEKIFPLPVSDKPNFLTGHWSLVTIRSHYPGGIVSEINGIPNYATDYQYDFPTESSTHLMRFFAGPDGSLPAHCKIAALGFFDDYVNDEESRRLDRWILELNNLPALGGTIERDTTYTHCPSAVLLPDGRVRMSFLKCFNHSNYLTHTVREVTTPDLGWNLSQQRIVFQQGNGHPGPAATVSYSLINGTLWTVGGGDIMSPACVRKSNDLGETWAAPVYIYGEYDEDDGATFAESNVISDAAGNLLTAVYGGFDLATIYGDLDNPTVNPTATHKDLTAKLMRSMDGGATWSAYSTISTEAGECYLARIPGTNRILAAINRMRIGIQLLESTDGGETWSSAVTIASTGNYYGGRPSICVSQAGDLLVGYRSTAATNGRCAAKMLPAAKLTAQEYGEANWSVELFVSPNAGFFGYVTIIEVAPDIFLMVFSEEPGAQLSQKSDTYHITLPKSVFTNHLL